MRLPSSWRRGNARLDVSRALSQPITAWSIDADAAARRHAHPIVKTTATMSLTKSLPDVKRGKGAREASRGDPGGEISDG